MLDVSGKGVRDDEGNVGATAPLVLTKLGQPAIAPGLGPLGFPEDHAGGLPDRAVDLLNNIGPQLALGDRLNDIHRKLAAQKLLKLYLENLTLGLLRALLRFAPQFLDRARH